MALKLKEKKSYLNTSNNFGEQSPRLNTSNNFDEQSPRKVSKLAFKTSLVSDPKLLKSCFCHLQPPLNLI